MKQKDVALILVIIFVSGVFSFVLSNIFISSPEDRKADVEVVEAITPEFPELDKRFFNNEALNPTRNIDIGDSQNPNPFQNNQPGQ